MTDRSGQGVGSAVYIGQHRKQPALSLPFLEAEK